VCGTRFFPVQFGLHVHPSGSKLRKEFEGRAQGAAWALLCTGLLPASLVLGQISTDQNAADPQLRSRSDGPSAKPAQVCPRYADRDWPLHQTIIATNPRALDAGALKPGTEISANVMYAVKYADCALDDNAVLYGHVTSSISSKEINKYELSVVFDHADCTDRPHAEIRLRLIGMVAPLDEATEKLRDALPRRMRSMGKANAVDEALAPPDYLPTPVHPGLVSRMPNFRLEPEGGPQCSARISEPDQTVELVTGTAWIFTRAAQVKK
jgi:hypothetical protein